MWHDYDNIVRTAGIEISREEGEVVKGVLVALFEEMKFQYFDRIVMQGMKEFPKSKFNTCGDHVVGITDDVIERMNIGH
jgi:hypothetical protein